jgi:hypothetical protein
VSERERERQRMGGSKREGGREGWLVGGRDRESERCA